MQLIKKLGYRKNKTCIHGHTWGMFLCSICNKEVERQLDDGKRGMSCGCNRFKHGEINTRLYKIWVGMKHRCLNSNNRDYKSYGSRGIKVCDEWLKYINFRDWALNNGYKDDLTIDGENNNGDYEPNNCRFVTSTVNNRNRSTVKLNLEKASEIRSKYIRKDSYTEAMLAREYNTDQGTISRIIRNQLWKG